MNVVELKYRTSTGVNTAYAFLDEDGCVIREKGLCAMATAVRGQPARPDAAAVKAFLDLEQPCVLPQWESLRQQFAAELGRATASNCTRCTRDAISRKYAKRLYEGNL